mmetsp:Transcript_5621/g.12329  ORF Transcript_5621/g.12329 Transcript_5621/m.12329 type:complete len:403 (-) Transcript_5621:289-1497(-)|eukprot:CAMPEP_0172535114 /NCGR_PEP_ID=MMETSP1067-20121228/7254_1 /TAXON_ID=265564 ORGANISM="Thalassiosira punctigera, Strain Tpunct2005C2" /NCGR_SAMPLE_ID=MMETSP1067 /ASSEMBLY_ACC=CAM_ASM_000444 /LENGTH=402 /DNA_ID=CAMNT_0013320009 /DNA_START=24 /DNA_END=1232 /DNA_ORIENTATION=+
MTESGNASSSAEAAAASSAPSSNVAAADARYTFDSEKLDELRKSSPWNNDPRYFKAVAVSPSAVMKMMTHCHSGVEKGVKKGGNPIEVMGLLLGRPDPATPRTLIVTDAYPLPIEGFETRVIADDEDVVNHMTALVDSLEMTRKENFMGWYHSHPFDVGIHSHCFLSQTDISTQLQWQRAEDPKGYPFLAIVVDPLRSLAKGTPELKAFRAFPPEYTNPVQNQCPDGEVIHEEQARLERWGSCWSSYYELDVEYFMSSGARNVLGAMTRNFLWMRTLGSTPSCEAEARGRFPDRVSKAAERIRKFQPNPGGGAGDTPSALLSSSRGGRGSGGASSAPRLGGPGGEGGKPTSSAVGAAGGGGGKDEEDGGELAKSCQAVIEIATEKLVGNIAQISKRELFSSS